MIIPRPFSKIVTMVGEPISVSPLLDNEALHAKKDEIERALKTITESAIATLVSDSREGRRNDPRSVAFQFAPTFHSR